MGYQVAAYRIPWPRLTHVLGSRDFGLIETIARSQGGIDESYYDYDEDDEEAADFEHAPTPREALAAIMAGGPFSDDFPEVYVSALAMLLWQLGERLDDLHLSSHDVPLLGMAEQALKDLQVVDRFSVLRLLHRGAPLAIPRTEDRPTIGYLTPSEALAAHEVASRLDVESLPAGVRTVIEQARAWVAATASAREGLVCVYD